MSPWRATAAEAVVLQGAVKDGDIALAVAEDDCVLQVRRVPDQLPQGLSLLVILAARRHEALDDGRGCRSGAGHLDLHGIVQEGIGKALDLRRHGRGEEERLAGERHQLHDALDIRDEAHVEHAVGLVDDEQLDAGEQELAALEMVEQAAGRGDQHVDAAGDLGILIAEGHAADEEGDGELVIDPVLVEVVLDLGGKFPGRLEDERARHARPGPAGFQQGQHGQREGRRLARARLRDAEHVPPREHVGNGLSLDGSRRPCSLRHATAC